jgi:hypothetical protein
MGRREARIPSGAKKSTEPPRWGRGGLECPAVSIHNTSEGPRGMRTRRKKQHRDTPTQKPLKDGVPPSGERVAGTGPRRENEMKGGGEVNPSTLRLREPSCIIHRWPHPWHARGGKGGSDFPVRGNRRRGGAPRPACPRTGSRWTLSRRRRATSLSSYAGSERSRRLTRTRWAGPSPPTYTKKSASAETKNLVPEASTTGEGAATHFVYSS